MIKTRTCDTCMYNDESLCGLLGINTSKVVKSKCSKWKVKNKIYPGRIAKMESRAARAYSLFNKERLFGR